MSILKTIPGLTVDIETSDPITDKIRRVGTQNYKLLNDKVQTVIPSESGAGMILVIDKAGVIKTGTDKFMVQQVSEQFEEKVQVSETLQEDTPALFMFGSKTVPCSFALKMLDTASANKGIRGEWYKGFQLFWETKLRASKLFKEKQTAVMLIDNEAIFGYPISMSLSKNSQEEFTGTITLNWLVLDRQTLFNDTASLSKFMNILNQESTWVRENTPLMLSLLDFLKVFSSFADKEARLGSGVITYDVDGNTSTKFKGNLMQLIHDKNITFDNNGTKISVVEQDKSGKYILSSVFSIGNLSLDRIQKLFEQLPKITGETILPYSEFVGCPQIYSFYQGSDTWPSSESSVIDIYVKVKMAISKALSSIEVQNGG